MRKSLSTFWLFAVLLASWLTLPATASADQNRTLALPVSGTFAPSGMPGPLATLGSGTFKGNFNVQSFEKRGEGVVAVGTVVGTLQDATGTVVRTIVQPNVEMPLANYVPSGGVSIAQLACEILHLELGPLDLNLLGLVIHLDQVVLDISAQPGPGNLLGNLLCAIVGLLDGGNLSQLVTLLNRLLDLLN
jgi:hypothetical protein